MIFVTFGRTHWETTSVSSSSMNKEPTSYPEKAKAALTMLAIGDCGDTTDKPGSCCNEYRKVANDSLVYKIDYWVQINVDEILAQAAGDIKSTSILSHGDNIYWNGPGTKDIEYRIETTFESVYDQPELQGIPWINVVGNHDLEASTTFAVARTTTFANVKALTSCARPLHVKNFKSNGVSVDVFNIETNFDDSHGVMEIFCQCYGYIKKKKLSPAESKKQDNTCNDRTQGDELCAGRSTEMYNTLSRNGGMTH
ncbi:hypothetical protein PsorP6_009395 [Peronosclerospora sorghi]|uniref:Uncharacterized protein n=1 Tax=Peronosclerospora sorghi TaxID=230839 RepID=A0ACC0W039_9STRA|nr:hypothetical protein PsorP6_009395 [Peronosclerospora sorghi]